MKKGLFLSTILLTLLLMMLSSCEISGMHKHSFGKWNVVTKASCESAGTKERMCKCGETESEIIPAIGHSYVDDICANCAAERPSPDEWFIFTELEDGSYSVKARDQYTISGRIIIPATYNGKPVTEIPSAAFGWCDKITEIVIPDSVTTIGTVAFHGCSSLIKVNIPKNVSEIPQQCFAACGHLEEVVMHDGITKIDYGAFMNCGDITKIDIPDGLQLMGDFAFQGCSNLESIYIPNGVELIGMGCFYSCVNLTEIRLPSSVKHIGNEAFFDCYMLQTVYLPDGIIRIHHKAFNLCANLSNIYYAGSEEKWNDIIIDEGNNAIYSATLHYNYTEE